MVLHYGPTVFYGTSKLNKVQVQLYAWTVNNPTQLGLVCHFKVSCINQLATYTMQI